LRPLTAYHIFFQLEREYIIQNAAGPDADASIHKEKSYIPGVPRRYRCTKLLPDWYAGPGKRRKRKHRKSHGAIGFLELSRVISARWAILESADPETKQYVTKIASKELAAYKVELIDYNEKMAANGAVTSEKKLVPQKVVSAPATVRVRKTVSPSKLAPEVALPSQQVQPPRSVRAVSLDKQFSSGSSPASTNKDEIDYSICSMSNNGHYIPSPGPFHSSGSNMIHRDGSLCDPLFELEGDGESGKGHVQRCVSPASIEANVDMIDQVDFFPLI
jgi:hypothetical protein